MIKRTIFIMLACTGWVFGSTQGPLGPTTGADNASIGTVVWSGPGNITAEDAVVSSATMNDAHVFDDSVKLEKGGVIGGNDKFLTAEWPVTLTYSSYGSASDLWGQTWTSSDINASNFGSVIASSSCVGTPSVSHYLEGTVYGFSIPGGSTINGILLEVKKAEVNCGPGGGSFVAGTKISTPHGEKNIEEIKHGEKIYSYDEATGERIINRVERAWSHYAEELLYVRAPGHLVLTTPEHRFLTGKDYQRADHLMSNLVMVQTREATAYRKVRDITPLKKREEVYEFSLKNDPHNYSANGFIVHNPPICIAGECAIVDYMRITVTYTAGAASAVVCPSINLLGVGCQE
jgi:hypothetical protein